MVTRVSGMLPRRPLPATMPAYIRANRFPRRAPLAMAVIMPAPVEVSWKGAWLSNWLLFNKLEAVFLLFESALQDPAGLCLVLSAGGLLLAFGVLLWVIFEVRLLFGD